MDVVESYVAKLNSKDFSSTEPRVEEFLKASTHFRATTDLSEVIAHSNILFILVDTPNAGGSRHYDVSRLGQVLNNINKQKVENKHVVIGCTVMPGYCLNIAQHLLRDCVNTSISYNPEFIQQGDIIRGFLAPDMVLIGQGNDEAGTVLEELYRNTCENEPVISRMSPSSAEICKISINCFITTKISYANMVGDIADATPDADKHDILRAVGADSRVGGKCLMPGYGFGGPCFPRDNRALGGYAESIGVDPLIPSATDNYNDFHAQLMITKQLSLEADEYSFTDVAYKPGCAVPIIEESQKLAVAVGVAKAGKKVTIRDREFILDAVRALHGGLFSYEQVDDLEADRKVRKQSPIIGGMAGPKSFIPKTLT
jgi:nucleotide sugar dehydrogenase